MQQVSYLFNEDFTKFKLSEDHPMKPMRLEMVHSLIASYGLTDSLAMYHSKLATPEELCLFHHPAYVKYLQTWVSPSTTKMLENVEVNIPYEVQRGKFRQDIKLGQLFKINQSFDCPGFEGLFEYCQLTAGSSIDAAHMVIAGEGDVVINWMGGFHHARKTSASGFCYINDIVLCILELLKVFPRVLYLDIDVHHGDGVEEAFLHTNRVMTVSFHQYQPCFFPETGALSSTGRGPGKYFSVNVPLRSGIDSDNYLRVFKQVMNRVMNHFRPDVAVVQCGADSLAGDRLGELNLSVAAHGECLQFMRQHGIPLVLLGGGGYTIQNVARCWTYETGLMVGQEIDNNIPPSNQHYYFYTEDSKIHFPTDKRANTNSPDYLDTITRTISENLKSCDPRPSVAFHHVPSQHDFLDSSVFSTRTCMQEEERERLFRHF